MEKQKRRSGEFRWIFFAAVGFVILLILMNRIFVYVSISNMEAAGDETIEYVKERLETYENYQANDRTKSLVRLLDKTREFVRDLRNGDATQEMMSDYVKEQRLDGILILNQDLQVVAQVVSQEESDRNGSLNWQDALQNDTLKEVIDCPKKVYMTRSETKEGTYDLAAVAREESSQVVIAYTRQETIRDGVNDITLDSNFENIMIAYRGLLVITDGDQTVAANQSELYKKEADDWKNLYRSGRKIHGDSNGKLLKVEYQGKRWYMRTENYQNKRIYVLFAAREIFLPYYWVVLGVVVLYLLLFGVGVWLPKRIERRCLQHLRESEYAKKNQNRAAERSKDRGMDGENAEYGKNVEYGEDTECGGIAEDMGEPRYRERDALDRRWRSLREVDLEQEPFSLRAMLNKFNEMIRMQCEGKNVIYRIKDDSIVHDHLIGCPVYFQQILMNIAGNAIKYNVENGTVTVGCREIFCDGKKAEFELTCADTGIGMSGELQERVFGTFLKKEDPGRDKAPENGYAGSSFAENRYAGTGQGMSVAGELLELLDGTMELESKEGEGSKFTVRISFRIDTGWEE